MIGDITIGHGASIDVDVLLATRGLIQSNSGGGAFNNPKGRLRSLGLIDYPARGQVIARPLLFLQ